MKLLETLEPFIIGAVTGLLLHALSAWWTCVAAFLRVIILPLFEATL